MSQDDRECFHQDRTRREKLMWNDRAGEMEFDHAKSKRRWRWPYRIRLGEFMAALGVLWMLGERFGRGLLS